MHLRRKLFKLALPMVIGYFIDPQLGPQRRQRFVDKVQHMLGRTPKQDPQASAPDQWSSTVVSETVAERLVVADENGRIVGDASVEAGGVRY